MGDPDRPVRLAGAVTLLEGGAVETRHANGSCNGLVELWGGAVSVRDAVCAGDGQLGSARLALRILGPDREPLAGVEVVVTEALLGREVHRGTTLPWGWMGADVALQAEVEHIVTLDGDLPVGSTLLVSYLDPAGGGQATAELVVDEVPFEGRFTVEAR